MKLKIPSSAASSQDFTTLLFEVRNYARWFAHESIKKRVDIRHASEPPIMSPAATQIIHEWTAKQPLNEQSLDTLIDTLKKYCDNSPSITFTLAAPPPNSLKATLVDWCRENIAPNILVAFKFNSTLLGGMVVSYGSHVFDWSFKRQLLDARNKFPEVLRRV